MPYESLKEVRERLGQVSPNLTRYGDVEEGNFSAQAVELSKVILSSCDYARYSEVLTMISVYLQNIKTPLSSTPIDVKLKKLEDYYMTDVISRSSVTMSKCVQAVLKEKQSKYYDPKD